MQFFNVRFPNEKPEENGMKTVQYARKIRFYLGKPTEMSVYLTET